MLFCASRVATAKHSASEHKIGFCIAVRPGSFRPLIPNRGGVRTGPMDETFRQYVEALHPAYERLVAMPPVKIATIPKNAPSKCIYLFSEAGKPLYVGRTNHLRQRMRQHSIPAAQHNQAVFAFKIARKKTGHPVAAYSAEGGRLALTREPEFAKAFAEAKARIREMEVRFVEEEDPFRQALLEIYAAVAMKTPYNDFQTS
jgi:predicted GIY-YIG superfamily endonuclease